MDQNHKKSNPFAKNYVNLSMKHFLFTFLVTSFVSEIGFSQDLFLVGAAGTYTEDTGGSVSWSLGELVIETASSSTRDITQGFQQGNIYVTGVEELKDSEISIYPNPAAEYVTIQSDEAVNVSIYDMSGRLVGTWYFTNTQNLINVSDYSRGTYSLVIESVNSKPYITKLVVL